EQETSLRLEAPHAPWCAGKLDRQDGLWLEETVVMRFDLLDPHRVVVHDRRAPLTCREQVPCHLPLVMRVTGCGAAGGVVAPPEPVKCGRLRLSSLASVATDSLRSRELGPLACAVQHGEDPARARSGDTIETPSAWRRPLVPVM